MKSWVFLSNFVNLNEMQAILVPKKLSSAEYNRKINFLKVPFFHVLYRTHLRKKTLIRYIKSCLFLSGKQRVLVNHVRYKLLQRNDTFPAKGKQNVCATRSPFSLQCCAHELMNTNKKRHFIIISIKYPALLQHVDQSTTWIGKDTDISGDRLTQRKVSLE